MRFACFFLALFTLHTRSLGQVPELTIDDDSLDLENALAVIDSLKARLLQLPLHTQKIPSKGQLQKKVRDADSSLRHRLSPLLNSHSSSGKHRFITLDGGMAAYQVNYRSFIDTPFIEPNIYQHSLSGNVRFTVYNTLPIRVLYLLRKSNSRIFRDIYDARVEYDATSFQNTLRQNIQKEQEAFIDKMRNPKLDSWFNEANGCLSSIRQLLASGTLLQRIIDANKMLRVPGFTYDITLPDSIAKRKSDSLKRTAAKFLESYDRTKKVIDSISLKVDSVKNELQLIHSKIARLKNLANGQVNSWRSYQEWGQQIQTETGLTPDIPKKYQWLLGIRQLGIGRNQVNYSELTAKNLSVTGLNFEYNSWYYVAAAAGLVDYRFRDFAIHPMRRTKQYMYLVRLGVGQLSNNYFIISAFKGQKQLYTSSATGTGITPVSVSGLTAESKWKFGRFSHVLVEAAQSFASDFRYNPPENSKSWDFSDKTNKAFAIKWYSFFPKTHSRIDAMYKYTGSNYQSFSSFQTNSAMKTWNIRADQQLFRKQLRITASVRSNDFSNPYILQTYASNSVFKSIHASFRRKKWPTFSLGYLPSSQLTKLDNQLLETRFYTLNSGISHFYKMGLIKASSAIIYNRFFNRSSDSSFIYFNATNLFVTQSFFFNDFTATVSIANTSNAVYKLIVLDENVQFNAFRWGNVGVGARVNLLNRQTPKVGMYGNVQIKINRQDIVHLSYDRGFLPGIDNRLLRNDFGNISFIKYFK